MLLESPTRANARRPRVPRGIVDQVYEGSPAARAGVAPGDVLLAINGLVPRDVVDVRLDTTAAHVELDLERNGSRLSVTVEKELDEDLGIEFTSPAFDRMKTCNNACEFCFIQGLPPGLRRSLYIKDDDFRYSFLYGNFTTLTNLSDDEWSRLLFQRLTPLRVSVHATDLALRRELLANPRAPDILQQLDELAGHGIAIHAQIVLQPGRNDGKMLEQTIADLAARYPCVESVAVVPVGLTRFSNAPSIRPLVAEDALAAIRVVQGAQRRFRKEFGVGFVYAADELYLLAGRPLPSARSYDDYPQLQNGVGLVQLFRAEWGRATKKLPAALDQPRHVVWATGALLAPLLEELANDLSCIDGLRIEVVAIENSMFGGDVTIAGLISGKDIVSSLTGRSGDRLVLPRSMFDAIGRQTIDGWTVRDIADRLHVEVLVGESPRDLLSKTIDPDEGQTMLRSIETVEDAARSSAGEELVCAES